jgi:hypothetical protein
MHLRTTPALSRRHFLRGGGALLGLPFLDAMVPTFARAETGEDRPQRFVAMCATLGFHAPFLIPQKAGKDYGLTPYLAKIEAHRDDFTVFSGLSHPEQQGNNGHASELTWLTSAKRPGLAGFKNSISLDQLIASKIGTETRYPYLALSNQGSSLSWTANGVAIPGQTSPSKLFKALFIDGTEKEMAEEMRGLRRGQSILDTVRGSARRLEKELGHSDREKLDQYLTSVRDLEARLQQSEGWVQKPKPKVEREQPQDIADRNDAIGKQRLMNDMIVLALQTDSTRTITYHLSGMNAAPSNIPGVASDWHNLSHHGKDETKIAELKKIEEAEFTVLDEFLAKLGEIEEGGRRLLDHTSVLYGSNLGNASSHDWRNVPILVAGGGFKHAGHLAFDPKDNAPLANLFVQLAQQSGIETEAFGSSTKFGIPGFNA